MRLVDARRVAVRKRAKIRFALAGGLECVINEHGVSEVPGLAAAPEFNLEEEFARASRFTLETAEAPGRPSALTRAQMEALAGEKAAAGEQAEE